MRQPVPWLWIVLAVGLLLLPGSAGRLLLDVLGGITLTLLILPLLLGGAALIGWQVLKRRLRTCPACGVSSLATDVCPACGTAFHTGEDGRNTFWSEAGSQEVDASAVTINVEAIDVDEAANDGGSSQS